MPRGVRSCRRRLVAQGEHGVAKRKYLRHQAASKRLLRRGNGHSKNEFMELRIEHELEASALLRLRHAIESYKAARTEIG